MIDVINSTAPSCAWLEVEAMDANGDEARIKRDLRYLVPIVRYYFLQTFLLRLLILLRLLLLFVFVLSTRGAFFGMSLLV